jgi:hypothetical protein
VIFSNRYKTEARDSSLSAARCSLEIPLRKSLLFSHAASFPNWRTQSSQENNSQYLVSSIKVEVKKKHLSNGWRFSCFAAHFIEQDLF